MWFARLLRRGAEPLTENIASFLSALQAEHDDLCLDVAVERFGDVVEMSRTAGLVVEYGGIVGPVMIQVSVKGALALRGRRQADRDQARSLGQVSGKA